MKNLKNKPQPYSTIFSLRNTAYNGAVFNEVDDKISAEKQEINFDFDNIGIIRDIVDKAELESSATGYTIPGTINIRINNLINQSENLQRIYRSYYIDKGDYFQNRKEIQKSLDAWEEVLKIDPSNNYIHLKLEKIYRERDKNFRSRLFRLKNRYQFKYIGSIRNNIVKKPIFMCTSEKDKIIVITDHERHKLHRVTTQGEYLGLIPVEAEIPLGSFLDEENNLWICDFGTGNLLCTDFDGNVLKKISINEILSENNEILRPSFGCIKENKIFLSISNKLWGNRRIISVNRDLQFTSLEKIYHDNFPKICDLKFINNALFALNHELGGLFTFNTEKLRFVKFSEVQFSGMAQKFTAMDNDLFISAGKHVLKMNLNGKLIFSVNLGRIFKESFLPSGLAICKNGEKKTLFVGDYIQNSIHMFSI